MKVTTKRHADTLLVGSLFKAGRTHNVDRFDSGKYKGVPSQYVGRDVPDVRGVLAVYPVARRDADGPYVQLMSVSEA